MGRMAGGKPARADDTALAYSRVCNEPHSAVPYHTLPVDHTLSLSRRAAVCQDDHSGQPRRPHTAAQRSSLGCYSFQRPRYHGKPRREMEQRCARQPELELVGHGVARDVGLSRLERPPGMMDALPRQSLPRDRRRRGSTAWSASTSSESTAACETGPLGRCVPGEGGAWRPTVRVQYVLVYRTTRHRRALTS